MALYTLPNELLLIIMNFMDMSSLMKLKCVCKRFYSLINSCDLLTEKSNHLLVTNQMSEEFRKRCTPLLSSYSSKFITHYNWINGIYKRRQIYESGEIYKIDLQLTQNNLLFFSGQYLYSYNRSKDGTVNKIKNIGITTCEDDFYSIIYLNNVLISGHYSDSVRIWRRMESKNGNDFKLLKVLFNESDYISTLDATSEYIVVLLDNAIKIHKYTYEGDVFGERNKIFVDDNSYIESIKFDPTGTKIAWINAAGDINNSNCLSIYDINNQNCQNKFFGSRRTILMRLLWEDSYTILMLCQKHIRKMDIRTSKFVRIWDAPDDVKFSCFSSDNLYTIITGTLNNKVQLWDQRKTAFVQEYVVNKNINTQTMYNHINSLSFDSRHLYIASHIWGDVVYRIIYEFDFKENNFDREKMKAVYSTNFGSTEFEVR